MALVSQLGRFPAPVGSPNRKSVELRGHECEVLCVAFSPDGRILASGGADGSIKTWGLPLGEEIRHLERQKGSVFGLAFSPDGQWLASASAGSDPVVALFDAA